MEEILNIECRIICRCCLKILGKTEDIDTYKFCSENCELNWRLNEEAKQKYDVIKKRIKENIKTLIS